MTDTAFPHSLPRSKAGLTLSEAVDWIVLITGTVALSVALSTALMARLDNARTLDSRLEDPAPMPAAISAADPRALG